MQRQAGFTLIELMIAVVVLVILTMLAAPSLETYFDKSRVRGAADSIINQVGQARQAAVKHDRDVALSTNGSGATWCLGALEADLPDPGDQAPDAVACECNVSASSCVVDGQQLVIDSDEHEGISLTSAAAEIVFDGRMGMLKDELSADERSFDLTSKSGRYTLTVSISPLGQATVCTKAGNILGYPSC